MKLMVKRHEIVLDVVTPLDRAIGGMLGLACADCLIGPSNSSLSHLDSLIGWGDVTLANIALASALLAADSLQMHDLLLRYQRQDGRHLYGPCALQRQWRSEDRTVSNSDSLFRVPISLQLLPIVLFYQQDLYERQKCIQSRLLLGGMVSEDYHAQLRLLGDLLANLLSGMPIKLAASGWDENFQYSADTIDAGLSDMPVILAALQQPDFNIGLKWVISHSVQSHAASAIYGVLAGVVYGEKQLPKNRLYQLDGGEELRNLAWMLYVGLPAPRLCQAILSLGLVDEHHRALHSHNLIFIRTPTGYQPGKSLHSAFGINMSCPYLSKQYRDAQSWLMNKKVYGKKTDVESAMLKDTSVQFIAIYHRYAQWLHWTSPQSTLHWEMFETEREFELPSCELH